MRVLTNDFKKNEKKAFYLYFVPFFVAPKETAIPEMIRIMMIFVFILSEFKYYFFGSLTLPPPSFGLTSCSVQAVMLMALTNTRMRI